MKTWHICVEDGPHQSYDITVQAPTLNEAIALAREQELKQRPWLQIMISPAACWELTEDIE